MLGHLVSSCAIEHGSKESPFPNFSCTSSRTLPVLIWRRDPSRLARTPPDSEYYLYMTSDGELLVRVYPPSTVVLELSPDPSVARADMRATWVATAKEAAPTIGQVTTAAASRNMVVSVDEENLPEFLKSSNVSEVRIPNVNYLQNPRCFLPTLRTGNVLQKIVIENMVFDLTASIENQLAQLVLVLSVPAGGQNGLST